MVKLGGYRVYCSERCQRKDLGREEEEEVLLERLRKIEVECGEKDAFIEQLRVRSREFENEVVTAEEKYVRELVEQKDRIVGLKREMEALKMRNEELQREFGEKERLVQKLEIDVAELNSLCRDMVATVRTLEEENKLSLRELEIVKKGVPGLPTEVIKSQSRPSNGDDLDCTGETPASVGPVRRALPTRGPNELLHNGGHSKRLLILCDETGRTLGSVLRRRLSSAGIQVQTFLKPGGSYRHILEDLEGLTRSFGCDDHVVVVAGINDFKQGKYPSMRYINSRIKGALNTNIMLLSTPSKFSNKDKEKYACKFNFKLEKFLNFVNNRVENRVSYLEVRNKMGYGLSNFAVSTKILNELNSKFVKNLKFVQVQDGATETVDDNTETVRQCITPDEISVTGLSAEVTDEACSDNFLCQQTDLVLEMA